MTEQLFGHYELLSLVGRGGMGEVWRAVDVDKQREVAVKVLGSWLGHDEDVVRRFRHEAALTARLNSPYVVPIHDYGDIDGRLYLEMPLVDGTDLGTVLAASGPLDPRRAVAVVSRVGRALAAAHKAGLVHRDVKPSNVLLTGEDGDEHVYLIDFGIARLLDGTRHSLTGALIGTPAYMAPERFEGDGDHRADVYALACVLYEALTGHKPFDDTGPWVLMRHHTSTPPPRPSAVVGSLPAALDDVVARGMAKDPADRFATADELAAAARSAVGPARSAGPSREKRPDGSRKGPEDKRSPRAAEPLAPDLPAAGARPVDRQGAHRRDRPRPGPREPIPMPPRFVPWAVRGGPGLDGPASIGQGRVVHLAGERSVVCRDAETGAQLWERELPDRAAPPVVGPGVVHVGCEDRHLYQLKLADGGTRWRLRTGGWIDGPAALDEERHHVHAVSHDHHLYRVDVLSGELAWRARIDDIEPPNVYTDRWFDAAPTVADGRVFVCSSDRRLHAVAADTGRRLWMSPAVQDGAGVAGSMNEQLSTPVVAGSVVAVAGGLASDREAVLHAFDVRSGRSLWQRPIGRVVRDTSAGRRLVAAGGCLVVRELRYVDEDHLVALDPLSGAARWRHVLEQTDDMDATGLTLVCVHRSTLRAFAVSDGRPLWARPRNAVDHATPLGDHAMITAAPRMIVRIAGDRMTTVDPTTGEGPAPF